MLMRDMRGSFSMYDPADLWAFPEDESGSDPDVRWPVFRLLKPVQCAGCSKLLPVDELITPHEQSMEEWLTLFERDRDAAARSLYSPHPDRSQPYCMDCYPVKITRVVRKVDRPGVEGRMYLPLPDAYEPGGSKFVSVHEDYGSVPRKSRPGRQPRRGPVPSRRGRFHPHR